MDEGGELDVPSGLLDLHSGIVERITPLQKAVESGFVEIVNFLLEARTRFKDGNSNVTDAFIKAVLKNASKAVVMLLVQYGGDATKPIGPWSSTALELAARLEDPEVLEILLSERPTTQPYNGNDLRYPLRLASASFGGRDRKIKAIKEYKARLFVLLARHFEDVES